MNDWSSRSSPVRVVVAAGGMASRDLLASDGLLYYNVVKQQWFARVGAVRAPAPFDHHDEPADWLSANGALGALIYLE